MNIIFLAEKLSGRGGIENSLKLYFNELKKNNYNIKIILFEGSDDTTWENTLQTIKLSEKFIMQLWPKYVKLLSKELLNLGDIDFILTLGMTATKVAKYAIEHVGSNAIIVSWLHLNLSTYKYQIDYLQYASAHLALSEGGSQEIKKYTQNSLVKVVYNATNTNVDMIPQSHIAKFYYIGRLEKVKQVDKIIESCACIKNMNFELHIVGDGSEASYLKNLAKNLKVNVTWHGWSQNPWSLIEDCTALILASASEAFGLVLIEALARGIPVISSNCLYGPQEIISEKNGWLFDKNNFDELVEILVDIISGKVKLPTKDLCIESVEKFAIEKVISLFINALLEISRAIKDKIH